MEKIIGIDLGTTQSCVAYLDGVLPRIIPNLEGLPGTPSIVSFTEAGEELIGNLALRQASTNPDKTIYAVKRLMGKKYRSKYVQETKKKVPYALTQDKQGNVMVKIDQKRLKPEEVSAMILGYLKKCAEAYFGHPVGDAVITVPAHFDDHQRSATKEAAQIAGLKVIRVINEPTAASLSYSLGSRKNAVVAVYDLGGGTFDFTLLEIDDGVFNVLATSGDTYLGGEDFNQRVIQSILTEFEQKYQADLSLDNLAMQRIRESVENAKKELSFKHETEINLPFISFDQAGSKHIRRVLTRKELESLTEDLIDRTFPYIEKALGDSQFSVDRIDEIILVGGQTRMPLVKQKIAEYFKKLPVEDLNPEESVALGAAIQSGIIEGELKGLILLLDVTPLSLGLEAENNTFVKIIEKNTTIPTKKTMAFTTVENDQRRVKIHVLQGESDFLEENTSLAVFDLVGIKPAPAGIPQINVTFEIDANGIVKVSARDMATGKEQKIEVNPGNYFAEPESESKPQREKNIPGESREKKNG